MIINKELQKKIGFCEVKMNVESTIEFSMFICTYTSAKFEL